MWGQTGFVNEVSTPWVQFFTYTLETFRKCFSLYWNFPYTGEDICTSVIREVKEETGVSDKNTICGLKWVWYLHVCRFKHETVNLRLLFYFVSGWGRICWNFSIQVKKLPSTSQFTCIWRYYCVRCVNSLPCKSKSTDVALWEIYWNLLH